MPQFLIERQIPGIEEMTSDELKSVARKSNRVLADLGSEIQLVTGMIDPGTEMA